MGWGGVVVAHVILVSAQGPNPSFFFFGGTFVQLGGLFDNEVKPYSLLHLTVSPNRDFGVLELYLVLELYNLLIRSSPSPTLF